MTTSLSKLELIKPIRIKLEVSKSVESERVFVLTDLSNKWLSFQKESQFSDAAVITIDSTRFPVHRLVLAAHSDFFRAAFTLPFGSTELNVPISNSIFQTMLEYFYTGHCLFNLYDISNVLEAADMLCCSALLRTISSYLETQLSYETCMTIYSLSKEYNLKTLYKNTMEFLKYNFGNLAHLGGKLDSLSFDELHEFLSDNETNVRDERQVLKIIVTWINVDEENRKEHLNSLLKCIREPIKFVYKGTYMEIPWLFMDEHNFPRYPRDVILVLGGWPDNGPTNCMETYDHRCQDWIWVNEAEDEQKRAYHGMVVVKEFVHVIGGFDGVNFLRTHRRFNLMNRRWYKCDTMYRRRCYVSVVELDNFIYAIGGFNGDVRYRSCERYDIEKNSWEWIASTRDEHSDAAVAEYAGRIYVVGGFNGHDILQSIEMYDPITNKWSTVDYIAEPRTGLSAAVLDDKIYFLGGYNGERRLDTVEIWDPLTQISQPAPPMNNVKSNFSAVIFCDEIWTIGGYSEDRETIMDVESFNPADGVWKPRASLALGRSALAAVVLKNVPDPGRYQSGWYDVRNHEVMQL